MSKFKLLTVGNPKTLKGEGAGYLTGILHLAPAKLSGWNVCPMATEGCKAACLNTAGRGGIAIGGTLTHAELSSGSRTNIIQSARIRRTVAFFTDRTTFMVDLVRDIAKLAAVAAAHGLKPAVRLNGTSDIRWEREAIAAPVPHLWNVAFDWNKGAANIMEVFPEVQFYDYTKLANRRDLPSNYRLTFSLADGNTDQAVNALLSGMNVAAVYRDKATRANYMRGGHSLGPMMVEVVDGDETDLRFLDPQGVIVGLYAKGNAKRDTSGFVVD